LLASVVKVVTSTHPSDHDATDMVRKFVRLGASPRALQSIVLSAKAHALIEGRVHVSREDVRRVAPAVLRHRLILSFEAATADMTSDTIIEDVLDRRLA
jgi:MoxR-like ATPase